MTKRPLVTRSTAIVGALLSAIAVVYASSLLGALLGAAIFFAFYRQLGPAPAALGSEPAPPTPMSRRTDRSQRAA